MSGVAIVTVPTFGHCARPCSRFWRREPSFWDLMAPSAMLEPFINQMTLSPLDMLANLKLKRMDNRDVTIPGHVKMDKDHFQVSLDVNQFSPNELSVKIVDNAVVVHGKHEEKRDEHGYISREFTRRYVLPEGVDAGTVTSSLSQDGLLVIEAPIKALEAPKTNERIVPIGTATNDKETSESNLTETQENKETVMETATE